MISKYPNQSLKMIEWKKLQVSFALLYLVFSKEWQKSSYVLKFDWERQIFYHCSGTQHEWWMKWMDRSQQEMYLKETGGMLLSPIIGKTRNAWRVYI